MSELPSFAILADDSELREWLTERISKGMEAA